MVNVSEVKFVGEGNWNTEEMRMGEVEIKSKIRHFSGMRKCIKDKSSCVSSK